MNKQMIHMFGRDHYLLGVDNGGTKYWLEAPHWDCGWYWGFGYIHTFTNNRQPTKSRDIQSLEHANDFYPYWIQGDKARLTETVFNKDFELAELFKLFYIYREMAEVLSIGSAYITQIKGLSDYLRNVPLVIDYNHHIIPMLMTGIIAYLDPDISESIDEDFWIATCKEPRYKVPEVNK